MPRPTEEQMRQAYALYYWNTKIRPMLVAQGRLPPRKDDLVFIHPEEWRMLQYLLEFQVMDPNAIKVLEPNKLRLLGQMARRKLYKVLNPDSIVKVKVTETYEQKEPNTS